jgi:hypothetical protein
LGRVKIDSTGRADMAMRGFKANVFIRKIENRCKLCKKRECKYGIDTSTDFCVQCQVEVTVNDRARISRGFRCDTALKLGGGERDFKAPLTDLSIH